MVRPWQHFAHAQVCAAAVARGGIVRIDCDQRTPRNPGLLTVRVAATLANPARPRSVRGNRTPPGPPGRVDAVQIPNPNRAIVRCRHGLLMAPTGRTSGNLGTCSYSLRAHPYAPQRDFSRASSSRAIGSTGRRRHNRPRSPFGGYRKRPEALVLLSESHQPDPPLSGIQLRHWGNEVSVSDRIATPNDKSTGSAGRKPAQRRVLCMMSNDARWGVIAPKPISGRTVRSRSAGGNLGGRDRPAG
jgi:hypothetical protein